MRPLATGRPACTAPRLPQALVPVDAATQAPGPGPSPRAALPASRRPHGPQGAPNRHADTLARAPRTAWPAQRALPRHALRPHSVGLLGPLPTAGWAARASQRPPRAPHPLGRPPLPMRPAPSSAPRQRNLLTAGPSARRGACRGHADALAHAPSAAWPAGRALPRHAHRPYCVGRSGPLPTAGWTAHTPPRPPRAHTRMAPRPTRPPAATHAPGPASTPRWLCRAASRKQDTGTGTRGQHLNRTQHANHCKPRFVLLCSRPCALPPL